MISKRKRVAVRKTARAANKNKYYILAGIAAAALGTYFLAGDQIKAFFERNNQPADDTTRPQLPPAAGGGGAVAPEPAGIDINKKLKKGVTGEEVKRLQYIINGIAALRNTTSYKTPAGYTVKFPIAADGSFGSDSQAGTYFIAPAFKDQGYLTLDQARKRLAYIAGYYNKPFPSSLVGTGNYKEYQTRYKAGEIDGSKNVDLNLPNVGLDLVNFPNPFN